MQSTCIANSASDPAGLSSCAGLAESVTH